VGELHFEAQAPLRVARALQRTRKRN